MSLIKRRLDFSSNLFHSPDWTTNPMCGIAGIIDFSGSLVEPQRIRRMTNQLTHRGPDASGVHVWPTAAFGHTRLSIIDLTDAAHQPMLTHDGQTGITYNGELYNYQDVRKRLTTEGQCFTSASDTEVVLQAVSTWGTKVLPELNGMFAFAVWDAEVERLTLARDRFGIKPLYYHVFSDGIVFGSEIKAILASGVAPRELHWPALHEYLYYGNALGSKTMFQGIHELPPGHCLSLTRNKADIRAYWSVDSLLPANTDTQEAVEGVRGRLERAVQDHLVSDVPVGVFLSGGIDSSAIAALARRHYGPSLKTFSAGFDFSRGPNELPAARALADRLGTDHHEFHISGRDVASVIEALARYHDQPFADAANVPLYLMARHVQGSVKVVLQGDGGDELFAGYRRYKTLQWSAPWRVARGMAQPLLALGSRARRGSRLSRFVSAMGQPDAAMRMALLLTIEDANYAPTRVLSRHAQQQVGEHDPFAEYRKMDSRLQRLPLPQRMLYTDCSILLPRTFLEKVDRATMAHGIEVRVPFLDANLADYVMPLPHTVKVRGRRTKWILREALRGVVPQDVLDGKKTGFSVPYQHWLRTSLADYLQSVLLDGSTQSFGLFDPDATEACIHQHIQGDRDNGFLLYKLLNLGLWLNAYLGPTANLWSERQAA